MGDFSYLSSLRVEELKFILYDLNHNKDITFIGITKEKYIECVEVELAYRRPNKNSSDPESIISDCVNLLLKIPSVDSLSIVKEKRPSDIVHGYFLAAHFCQSTKIVPIRLTVSEILSIDDLPQFMFNKISTEIDKQLSKAADKGER